MSRSFSSPEHNLYDWIHIMNIFNGRIHLFDTQVFCPFFCFVTSSDTSSKSSE